jgi:hypothetical protein
LILIGSCFSSIVGAVFLSAGLCGIGSQYFKSSQKPRTHPVFYGFFVMLGAAFLGAFFALAYLGGHSAELTGFFMSNYPYSSFLMFVVFLFGGTSILTVGVCGTVRRYFRRNQNLFTMFVAVLVPSLVLLPFVYFWIGALEVGL